MKKHLIFYALHLGIFLAKNLGRKTNLVIIIIMMIIFRKFNYYFSTGHTVTIVQNIMSLHVEKLYYLINHSNIFTNFYQKMQEGFPFTHYFRLVPLSHFVNPQLMHLHIFLPWETLAAQFTSELWNNFAFKSTMLVYWDIQFVLFITRIATEPHLSVY